MKKPSCDDESPRGRTMNKAPPATRGPPSPVTRRLNRSKSLFSLTQDFFRLRLNPAPEEPVRGTLDNDSIPGPWNILGSLRGKWGSTNTSSNPQKTERRSTSQFLKQPTICKYLPEQSRELTKLTFRSRGGSVFLTFEASTKSPRPVRDSWEEALHRRKPVGANNTAECSAKKECRWDQLADPTES